MKLDPLHLVDVCIYVVVLNLAFQFVPDMIAETFAMSLLTAVLLKLVVEAVLKVKKSVLARRAAASTGFQRVTSVAMLVLILPGSKFVILWLEDLVFGDAVSLGGFWSVTILVFALTFARKGVRLILAPTVR